MKSMGATDIAAAVRVARDMKLRRVVRSVRNSPSAAVMLSAQLLPDTDGKGFVQTTKASKATTAVSNVIAEPCQSWRARARIRLEGAETAHQTEQNVAPAFRAACDRVGGVSGLAKQPQDEIGQRFLKATATKTVNPA